MRLFPRARPLVTPTVTLVGVLALTGALAIPSASADEQRDLEKQQRTVQGQIDATADALEQSRAEVSSAAAALLDARTRLSGARTRLADVQEQLEEARGVESQVAARLVDTRAALATARSELAVGQQQTVDQRASVAETISDIYQQGDAQLMAFASILDAETPADVTRRMNFSDVVVGREDQAYGDLREAEAALAAREAEVEQAEADVAAQQRAAADNVAAIEGLESDARGAEAEVVALVGTTRAARADAAAQRDADAAALAELRQQDETIKQQILEAKRAAEAAAAAARAAALAAQQQPPAVVNGLAGDGTLLAPVEGRITSPFGYRRHPIYGYWGLHDGTDFGAACGTPLRAAGTGKVLTTVYSSSYGNRLFLDLGIVEGKALTVVYNHLSGYAASTGDVVQRGETVGYVGTTGWSTGCHLHFTVLEDGEPVDAVPYL